MEKTIISNSNYPKSFVSLKAKHNIIKTSKGLTLPYSKLQNSKYSKVNKKTLKFIVYVAKNIDKFPIVQWVIENVDDVATQIYLIELYGRIKTGFKGLQRSYNKLSKSDISKILEMYENGRSIYAIAKQLNKHVSTVYYVIKRYGLK